MVTKTSITSGVCVLCPDIFEKHMFLIHFHFICAFPFTRKPCFLRRVWSWFYAFSGYHRNKLSYESWIFFVHVHNSSESSPSWSNEFSGWFLLSSFAVANLPIFLYKACLQGSIFSLVFRLSEPNDPNVSLSIDLMSILHSLNWIRMSNDVLKVQTSYFLSFHFSSTKNEKEFFCDLLIYAVLFENFSKWDSPTSDCQAVSVRVAWTTYQRWSIKWTNKSSTKWEANVLL